MTHRVPVALACFCAFVLSCYGLAGRDDLPVVGASTAEQGCIESCRAYDDEYLVFYALGMAFSGVTAASGTSGILSATLADEPNADIALAATAAGSGIATVVFNWLSGESAERYTECVERCGELPTVTAEGAGQ